MDALQVPGVINSTKFLVVGVIWLLIVFAVAGVISGIDHQWMPPHDLLYDSKDVLKPDLNRSDQCEALNFKPGTLAGTVLEPENTWSNAGYLLAGMLILVCTKRPLGYLVGIQLCVLAALSGAYHATLQENMQTLDVAGIYFILTGLLFYVLQAAFVRGLSPAAEWILAAVLSIVSFGSGLFMANNRTKVYMFGSTTFTFTVVCALVVLCVYEMGRKGFNWGRAFLIWRLWTDQKSQPLDYFKVWRMFSNSAQSVDWNLRSYFIFFVFIGAPGIACRLLDGDGNPLCSAGSTIQAHSVWHTFGAATLLIGYDLFAWSGGWARDFPVFQRKEPPKGGAINKLTLYGTAFAALVIGLGLWRFAYIPGWFVDKPDPHDPSRNPIPTGVTIACFFLLTALTISILRWTGVISDPAPDY